MATVLKFLHASDLHLDSPITGLSEIPAHLKSPLAGAPWSAAESIFDLALSERVDFILLAGDVVDLERGGPRAAAFLLGQFERMADKGVRVYWCGGSIDHPDRWPAVIELPDNVVIFPSTVVEQATHLRNGKRVATICGSGYEARKRNPGDFRCDSEAPFPIALVHGDLDTTSMTTQGIRYWALGGRHKASTIDKTGSVARYPGTTQGRSPSEPGSHGCSLVTVDETGRVKISEVELDSVRWTNEKIAVAENATLDDLKTTLADRCSKVRAEFGEILTLCRWRVEPTGSFNPELRKSHVPRELMTWLREQYGRSDHGLWSAALSFAHPETLPGEWYEEDTILGDYLRAIGRYQGDSGMALSVADFLDEMPEDDQWQTALARIAAQERESVLRQAALVGIEYLHQSDHRESA